MKLSNTKTAQSKTLVPLTDEISMKMLPMKGMLDLFEAVGSDDKDVQAGAIDAIFETIIVDSKGKKFEDLEEGTATEVLPMPAVMDIMSLMAEKLNPNAKK